MGFNGPLRPQTVLLSWESVVEYNKATMTPAKAKLSRLLSRLRVRVEGVLLRGGTGLEKLLPAKDRVPGRLRGKISYTPDAFVPLQTKSCQT